MSLANNLVDEEIGDVFQKSRLAFPERWRADSWYLTVAAALIGSGQQAAIGSLYKFVLKSESLNAPDKRKAMVRRLREAMVKCIILNGIPKVLLAFHSLAAVEEERDQDHTFTREHWVPDEENNARASRVLDTIYRGDQHKAHAACGAHADVAWISTNISYGLFLADHQVLNTAESELVILPAIMCQDLKGPTSWHVRGCLRVGLTREEVDAVQKVVAGIVEHGGGRLSSVESVWDMPEDA